MSAHIVDSLQGDLPEVIEEYLERGVAKCVAFNRRGTLLAAGCFDGRCVIWDFETRGVAKELRDKDLKATITSICWSKYGHRVLVSAADKSLTLWDVVNGDKIARLVLQQTPLQACLDPGSVVPSICLVCPVLSAPMIVDLNTASTVVLPTLVSDKGNVVAPPSRNRSSDRSTPFAPAAACFNKYGDLVYVGNSKGEILIVDQKSIKIIGIIPVPGGAVIKNVVFSRNGQFLLTNSGDGIIRIYENLLPLRDALQTLDDTSHREAEIDEAQKLRTVGSKCLALLQEFQDSIMEVQWKAACFSGNGEWVVGASTSQSEHKIYIWDMAGHLVEVLEGPKEAIIDLAWHPVRPILLSVSLTTGLVYIWAKDYTESWSAFAPDFVELEENEEYVEREDEFDLNPETEKVMNSDINEDEEVDILAAEVDTVFSDSDMLHDEICFLPSDPCPDLSEQQVDGHVVNNSHLGNESQPVSPLSEKAGVTGQTGHLINHKSSPVEEDTGGQHLSKKRKPSEKARQGWIELSIDDKPMAAASDLSNFIQSIDSYEWMAIPSAGCQV